MTNVELVEVISFVMEEMLAELKNVHWKGRYELGV
jgi:hypothetical protein